VRLLIATSNRDKVREITPLLQEAPVDLVTLDALPPIAAPEETGTTFEENARAKALYYSAAAGMIAVAEDSGLEIDALGGVPGVESARFGGVEMSYPDRFTLLYDALRAKNANGSSARFVCALALVDRGRILFETRGTVEGHIAPAPQGTGGFGYDPIFFYPPFNCTLAEAGDRKSSVSHRGKAFRSLAEFLKRR